MPSSIPSTEKRLNFCTSKEAYTNIWCLFFFIQSLASSTIITLKTIMSVCVTHYMYCIPITYFRFLFDVFKNNLRLWYYFGYSKRTEILKNCRKGFWEKLYLKLNKSVFTRSKKVFATRKSIHNTSLLILTIVQKTFVCASIKIVKEITQQSTNMKSLARARKS